VHKDTGIHTHILTEKVDKAKDLKDEAEKGPSVNVCV
jgi:hypothetical protein